VFKKTLSSCPFFTWIPPSRLVDVLMPVNQLRPACPRVPTVPIWTESWTNALLKDSDTYFSIKNTFILNHLI